MAVKPRGTESKICAGGQANDEMTEEQYKMVSRCFHIFRTIEGYFSIMTAMDDQMGMAIFGLGTMDPLQLLQVEFDNFSGLKKVSIPRRMKEFSKPTIFMDSSKKFINVNDSQILNSQSITELDISEESACLLTGQIPFKTALQTQRDLFRSETTSKKKGEKSGKQKFITWFGPVDNGLYREYRINAEMIAAPGSMTALQLQHERDLIVRAFLKKRIYEMPHFKKHYKHIMDNLDPSKVMIIAAVFVSSYSLICRFEQDNFTSNFEWAKPRRREEFRSGEGKINLIHCKISDSSPLHYLPPPTNEELLTVSKRVKRFRKWMNELETSPEACIQIMNISVMYCTVIKDQTIVNSFQKIINGFYYALHVLQYREQLMAQYGQVPEHILTVVYRCLDPCIRFSSLELGFLGMWNYREVTNRMLDVSYAVNFFETARRESTSERNSKRMRKVYADIFGCLARIGMIIREKTRRLHEEVPVEKIVMYMEPL